MSENMYGAILGALPECDVNEVLKRTAKRKFFTKSPKIYCDLPDFPGDDTQKFSSTVGRILMGRFTTKHQERLERCGYETEIHTVVVDKNGTEQSLPFLYVFHNGFVDKVHVNDLNDLIKNKKLLHYKSKVVFNDGTVAWGIPACKRLEAWAAIMANPVDDTDEVVQNRNSE